MTTFDFSAVVWQHAGLAETIEGQTGFRLEVDVWVLPDRPFVAGLGGKAVECEVIGHTPDGYPVVDPGAEWPCLL